MEMKKQRFGKQMFAGPEETLGPGEDFDLQALLVSDTTLSPYSLQVSLAIALFQE